MKGNQVNKKKQYDHRLSTDDNLLGPRPAEQLRKPKIAHLHDLSCK